MGFGTQNPMIIGKTPFLISSSLIVEDGGNIRLKKVSTPSPCQVALYYFLGRLVQCLDFHPNHVQIVVSF